MSPLHTEWTAHLADTGYEILANDDTVVACVPLRCNCAEHRAEARDNAALLAAAPRMRDALRHIARMAETGEYGIGEIAAGTLAHLVRPTSHKPIATEITGGGSDPA